LRDRTYLGADHADIVLVDGANANGVLGGDRRDDRHPIDAQGGECLHVGLDAGTGPRVRAGDGQRDRQRHAITLRSPRYDPAATRTLATPEMSAPCSASINGWLG